MNSIILSQLNESFKVLEAFMNDSKAIDKIDQAADLMAGAINNNGKII